jgi:hypothetical protein
VVGLVCAIIVVVGGSTNEMEGRGTVDGYGSEDGSNS